MLARGLLCRLAADAPKSKTSAHDLPQLARLVQRSLLARNGLGSPAVNYLRRTYRNALVQYGRAYATAAAAKKPTAKKATVKPTSTVKKAVKKTAATKTPAARKKAPLSKRKPATKKPAAKKKVVAKKKKKSATKAKPKPKKAKKEVSPERKQMLKVRALKKTALGDEPSSISIGAWHIITRELLSSGTSPGADGFKQAYTKFKSLTPAELEHYNHLANVDNDARKKAYKAWVESHTTEEIRLANNARMQLRHLCKTNPNLRVSKYLAKIKDERHVKKAPTAYLLFVSERHATGDLKNISPTEGTKLVASEWRALGAAEKQRYIDAAEAGRKAHSSKKNPQ